MWVPLEKKNKTKQNQNIKGEMGKDVRVVEKRKEFFSFCFYFILRFFLRFKENRPSEFVGINTESALRDEGYA